MTDEGLHCENCGEEIEGHKKFCRECRDLNVNLYYEYRDLRFHVWEFLNRHGTVKARELYNNMVDEEGEKWAREALGNKLVDAILIRG